MQTLVKAFALAGVVLLSACSKHDADARTYDLSDKSNNDFLADYAAHPDSIKRPDGLMYKVLKAGTGQPVPGPDAMVVVTYKGTLINGKVFDQSPPGQPRAFTAGNLIPGWVEALSLMKEGDEWQLVIPPELGYGSDGAGKTIPPNQTLVFTLSLLKVLPPNVGQ